MYREQRKSKYPSLQGSCSNQLSPLKKKIGELRYASNHYDRCRTQESEGSSSIFPLQLSAKKRFSTSEKDPKKEYVMIRQQRLKKQYDDHRLKINKGELQLPLKRTALLSTTASESKRSKKPNFSQNVSSINLKDLQCNILHLMRIFQGILKKKDPKMLIQNVKRYILQEQSDLNELQMCLMDKSNQLAVKNILFYQRFLLIMLVECLINKKYRFNEQNFLQIFKQFVIFYSVVYQELAKKHLSKLVEVQNIKYVLPYLPQKGTDYQLVAIKESIAKRVTAISKQFVELDSFVNRHVATIKSCPSNLNYYKLLQFYASKLTGGNWSQWNIEFLETCPSPYIHHETSKKYTLLLDLDQTLVHYRNTTANRGQFLLRPHLFSFLSKLEPHYELGIFTCAMQNYADVILEHLSSISFRLYRQHAVKFEKQMYKDLSRVGRDLSRVILVDNLEKNFDLQKENGIHVRSWYGDPKDTILEELGQELEQLAKSSPEDLRKSTHKRSFL